MLGIHVASVLLHREEKKVVEIPIYKKVKNLSSEKLAEMDDGRKGDNDEKLLANFKRKLVDFVTEGNRVGKLIRSQGHLDYFKSLLRRGIINHRMVDFEFFRIIWYQNQTLL
ncbi:hypothetical protein BT93_E1999 [Corymbia citriodora subsp. variegata]|nr:hypothetical protein BT93_E1999 [Corymbia citriodora subsp. variegata]